MDLSPQAKPMFVGIRKDKDMRAETGNDDQIDHEMIANLARQIWEREGRQTGRILRYWLRAEQQLLAARHAKSILARFASPALGVVRKQGAPEHSNAA